MQLPVPLLVFIFGTLLIACIGAAWFVFIGAEGVSFYTCVAQLVWSLGHLVAAVRYSNRIRQGNSNAR
jgi:fatty-acid desaturase